MSKAGPSLLFESMFSPLQHWTPELESQWTGLMGQQPREEEETAWKRCGQIPYTCCKNGREYSEDVVGKELYAQSEARR